MTTIAFDFPVWFNATPLKHTTPKMVRGIFRESFDVPDVDPADVNPAMSLVIADAVKEYVEIAGGFYVAAGNAKSGEIEEQYLAENSPIPCVRTEYLEMDRLAIEKAKASSLALFPKQAPNSKGNYPVLSREWFSETDLYWLEKRAEPALAFLGRLRCADGQIYEPIPEPMFVVNMATTRDDGVMSISMEFRASTSAPFSLGYPVAFFRADQGEEAIAYAEELATRHSIPLERAERREIVIHERSSLSFNPYLQQILEAASVVMVTNQRHVGGDKHLAAEIGSIIGDDHDGWRTADQSTFGDEVLVRLEDLVRQGLEDKKTEFPPILIETLLERWDERPIIVASPGPTQALGKLRAT